MVKNTCNAFIRFLSKKSKYPKRKKYSDIHKSFYVDSYKIEFIFNKIKLEKIADSQKENRRVLNYVKMAAKNRIPIGINYYNPRVTYDGERLYITVVVFDINRPVKKSK